MPRSAHEEAPASEAGRLLLAASGLLALAGPALADGEARPGSGDGGPGFRMVIPTAGQTTSTPVPGLDGANTETSTEYGRRRAP